MKSRIVLGICAMFMLLAEVAWSQSEARAINHVEGELLVLLRSEASATDWCRRLEASTSVDFWPEQRLSQSMNLWLIRHDAGLGSQEALLAAERDRSTKIAQLNHTNLSVRAIPDDSLFGEQWNFLNDGTNGGGGTVDVEATDAWDITQGGLSLKGDTIVVAVIDQGFQIDHPDLWPNMYTNHHEIANNGLDDDGNGFVDDIHGWDFYSNDPVHPVDNHGTHVSGTVGAKGNNGTGVTGVNWNVKILPISGSSSLEATVVSAYAYVLDMRRAYNQSMGAEGAYIVATNSSFGIDDADPLDYPLWCAMYDSLGYEGVLSAGATANDNVDVDIVGDVPTACPSNFLISVTNTTSTDALYHNAAWGTTHVDLSAPGTSIYSTKAGSNYGTNTGTSMATPHVAGTIGLMYSAICEDVLDQYAFDPAGLATYVKTKLLTEGVDHNVNLENITVSEGRLNIRKAIEAVSSECLAVSVSSAEPECDSCNGTIAVNVLGGVAPYTYAWSNGASTDSISGLCAGHYFLTVTDADGVEFERSISLSNPNGPNVQIDLEHPECHDALNGEIHVSGAAFIHWLDGNFGASRSSLEAGDYFLIASDSAESCSTSVKATLIAPDTLKYAYTFLLPSSEEASDGSITVEPMGGTPGYSYLWYTGDTTATLSGLSKGKHAITITDANGCVMSDSVQLGFPNSVAPLSDPAFEIFPNPVSDRLEISSSVWLQSLRIMDATGRAVQTSSLSCARCIIDMASYPSGIYLLQLEDEQGHLYTKKVVKHGTH